MYINSINYNQSFASKKIKPMNIKSNKQNGKLTQEEINNLLKLKKIYMDLENFYKSENFQEIMARRKEYLNSIDRYIKQKENNIIDQEFNI